MVLPAQITQEFHEFYSHLYNIPLPPSHLPAVEEYIKTSQLPSLPPEICAELDFPIALLEPQQALGSMKPGKAPGPDGYTIQ